MRFEKFSFGSIRIDGVTHEHDVQAQEKTVQAIPQRIRTHPLSVAEKIPWKCRRLVIGAGTGALPVMKKVKRESQRRKVKLLVLPISLPATTRNRSEVAVFISHAALILPVLAISPAAHSG